MEEQSIERIFSLEEIDYAHFWGTNDKMLDFVRILFPKLKLIARGEMLKAVGSVEDIDYFDGTHEEAHQDTNTVEYEGGKDYWGFQHIRQIRQK